MMVTSIEHGLYVWLWLTADDSPDLIEADVDQHLAHVHACVSAFDDIVSGYVVGLEMDSDGRKKYAKAMISKVKEISRQPVGVHLNPGKWQDAVKWGANYLFHQFSRWQTDPRKAVAEAEKIIGKLDGKCTFIASEYHKSSDSEQARRIGTALLKVRGCEGVGNGSVWKADEPIIRNEWDRIKWISENYAGAVLDMEGLIASVAGNHIRFSYPAYSWPDKVVKVPVDAIACFFVRENDRWVGGKYEWIRKGGQTVKETKNIREGYGGLSVPANGARVAFAWVSVDGKLRSNIAETVWR